MSVKSAEKRVLVDMDGVIAGFDRYVLQVLAEEYPEVPIPSHRASFYIDDDMDPVHKPIIREIISRPGFFRQLSVLPGAHQGWERLIEEGYTPQICTSPLRKNPTCNTDKLLWLEEHFVPRFGHWVIDTAIIDKDKTRHPGRALIDDRPHIVNSENAAWQHIVFDQPYNQASPAPHRLRGWADELMPTILASIE